VHIQVYKEAGYLQKEMVQKLNPSTISRELKKNSSKVYKRCNAKKADVVSQDTRVYASKKSNFKRRFTYTPLPYIEELNTRLR
jgi:IS30 family transposase